MHRLAQRLHHQPVAHEQPYPALQRAEVPRRRVLEIAIDAGAEDVREDDGNYEILTAPEDFESVKKAIDGASIPYLEASITMYPATTTNLSGSEAEQMVRLMESLEDCDDVQKVYTNADIPSEILEKM